MRWTVACCLGAALGGVACANEPAAPGSVNPGVSVAGGAGTVAVATTSATPAAAGRPAEPTTPTVSATPTPAAAGSGSSTSASPLPTTSAGAPATVGSAGGPAAPITTAGAGGVAAPAAAGASAAAGSSAAPAAGSGGSSASAVKPKCLSKGAELALIGDSWINYPLGQFLAPRLAQRAQKDGALAARDMYNDQAVAGTSLASGGLGLISDQWEPAKAAARAAGTTVKFVVMDGGGNDVLLGNQRCLDNGQMRDQDPTCQKTVKDATMVGMMLQQKMKMDGVGQAVYFFYPHVPAGGWDVLDYSLPMAKAVCEGLTDENYQCYFVDTREAFQGAGNNGVAMANLIGPDGIHPSAAGDDVLADLIWKTMKDHCMAQSAASGCCTP